jgi:uncharacterized protein
MVKSEHLQNMTGRPGSRSFADDHGDRDRSLQRESCIQRAASRTGVGFRSSAVLLLLIVVTIQTATAQQFASPVGFVNDFADIIGPVDEARLNVIIHSVKKATGAEIAVVTLGSLLGYSTIEELASTIANAWGVGQKEINNGVMLVVAMAERRTRIEVGLGLEDVLTDDIAGRILDTWMIPNFRENDFGTGMIDGVAAIAQVIALYYVKPVEAISFGFREADTQ